jgi:hypothetical protein
LCTAASEAVTKASALGVGPYFTHPFVTSIVFHEPEGVTRCSSEDR